MIYVWMDRGNRPHAHADLDTAKQQVEQEMQVLPQENPQWYEHGDRWILAVRWRSRLGIVWKVQM